MDSDGDCGSDAGAEWVWVRRPAEAEAVAAAAGWPAAAADEEARPLKVVFASPARYFTDAAPIGNGRLGAMVWGGVESERLQLNRKSTASTLSMIHLPCSSTSSLVRKNLGFLVVNFSAPYSALGLINLEINGGS